MNKLINIQKFEKWLRNRGCEILPVTNEHEWLRFRGKKVGVLYLSGKTSNSYTQEAIMAYQSGGKWNGRPARTGRSKSYRKQKEQILDRDGDCCFLCGKPMGDDITLEHLVPLSKGGKNTIDNMVLMDEECNQSLDNMGLIDKMKIIIKTKNQTS